MFRERPGTLQTAMRFAARSISTAPAATLAAASQPRRPMNSTDFFKALAGSVSELVFIWTEAGQMLWTNEAFVRETGLTVEDFGFRNPDNPFIHPADLPQLLEQMGAFAASDARRSPPIANRFFDAWGRTRSLVSVVHKVDWEGTPALAIVSSLVGEGRDRAAADDRPRALMEAADDGILELSVDGAVVYSNRRFQAFVGAHPVQIARRHFVDFLATEDRAAALAALQKLRDEKVPVAFEARLRARDGVARWLAVHVSPVRLLEGAADMLVIARDVTEARRLEERLRQRQRLESLGVLVAGIAHDLNNIATSVLANASLAERSVAPGTDLAVMLRDIRVAAQRARSLNSALLAYAGKAPTQTAVVDVARAADETLRLVSALEPKSVQLVRVAEGDLRVRADAAQLGQVLLNLLTNAADAIGPGPGTVLLETRKLTVGEGESAEPPPGRWVACSPPPGRYALVRVRDDGCGMNPAMVEKIFDPFFTTKEQGRGLGLSIVLGILQGHAGHLRIDTEPGRGTTFDLLLPLAPDDATLPSVPSSPAAAPPRLDGRVLFVDDEAAIRSISRRILEEVGHEVVLAANAEEALSVFRADPAAIAVAVLDYTMPGMNGRELARRLRAIRPELPIVQASGLYQTEGDDGANLVFLAKPFLAAELERAIAAAWARSNS
jgi:PAS domain S-box-containing protein